MVGTTVLHYRITEQLGAGGMGVVYKAEDTKLERTVALKFLPARALVTDEERARFKLEARTAGSLSHANIAHIYEINEHEGDMFIAMEFVEGETLSEKVKKAPLKIKDAIKIAIQIAEGLSAAHENGIIHRDIKSTNIMITPKGVAKIMDFGLAKLSSASTLTQAGTAVGTISYMSPEQTRGEEVDYRTDIWALGVILYDMIAGQRPFRGEYDKAIIYAILHVDPKPLTATRAGVPMGLERIVMKLLAKEADDRYQNIVELPVDLKNVDLQETATSSLSSAQQGGRWLLSGWKRDAAVFAAAAALTFIVFWGFPGGDAPETTDLIYSQIAGRSFSPQDLSGSVAISPDGKYVTFVDEDNDGTKLFLRPLDSPEARPIPNTNHASKPSFSPDGRWILFFNGRHIAKVQRDGGAVVPIVRAEVLRGVNWVSDATIVYSAEGVIYTVSALGAAEPQKIVLPDAFAGRLFLYPTPLRGTNTILIDLVAGDNYDDVETVAYDLGTGEIQRVFAGGITYKHSASGHLIYVAGSASAIRPMVVPFDSKSLTVSGTPVPLPQFGVGGADISDNGTFVASFDNDDASAGQRLVLVGRDGELERVLDRRKKFRSPKFSPDGEKIAVSIEEYGESDIWIMDSGTMESAKVTNSGKSYDAVWSTDGSYIVFQNDPGNPTDVFKLAVDGTGAAELLFKHEALVVPLSWSGVSANLLFYEIVSGNRNILYYSVNNETISPFLATDENEFGPDFSPDGRWVVYTSHVSERSEIYVRPFPPAPGSRTITITTEGGREPVWSPKGNEIFYWEDNNLISVKVVLSPSFRVTGREVLFSGEYAVGNFRPMYDVHPDGGTFLMVKNLKALEGDRIMLIQNFFALLKDIAPTDRE